MTEQWRGVNLGGWLVLERWMTPSVFAGTAAADEFSWCQQLGPQAAKQLQRHRDTFITEADFTWIADHGLNAVRLPVGYWCYGDEPPYIGCLEYIDRAFSWAKKHNLGILLDLHGAPGSQNGHDHSGRIGSIEWGEPANVEKTLHILEKLAERYGKHPALIGIELLNEPSIRLGKRRLRKFYETAEALIRPRCADSVAVVFHDAFRPYRWKNVLRGPSSEPVVMDHHYYQVFGWRDTYRSVKRHLQKPSALARRITKWQKIHPVIIGEWSLALPAGNKPGRGAPIKKAYAQAQLRAMNAARGWFFWSYKTEAGGPWSYRDAVARGWLPKNVREDG